MTVEGIRPRRRALPVEGDMRRDQKLLTVLAQIPPGCSCHNKGGLRLSLYQEYVSPKVPRCVERFRRSQF